MAEWLVRWPLNLQFTGSDTGGATWSTTELITHNLLKPIKLFILSGLINYNQLRKISYGCRALGCTTERMQPTGELG